MSSSEDKSRVGGKPDEIPSESSGGVRRWNRPPEIRNSILLPPETTTTTTTPSSEDGIDVSTERKHRWHGTSIIKSAAVMLRYNDTCYATACTLFHRCFHRISLRKLDVWSVAMASTLLAGKVEEDARPVKEIITAYVHLYRRRRLRLVVSDRNPPEGPTSPLSSRWSVAEKEFLLERAGPLSPFSQAYRAWREALLAAEHRLLRALGFTLYWIPDSHPHKFLLYMGRILQLEGNGDGNGAGNGTGNDTNNNSILQSAWNWCNDSYRLDLCVRYPAELVACAALWLATTSTTQLPPAWWEAFVGPHCGKDLATVVNVLLSLTDPKNDDLWEAEHTFLPSLLITTTEKMTSSAQNMEMEEGSFNDPGSFVWCYVDEIDESAAMDKDKDKNRIQPQLVTTVASMPTATTTTTTTTTTKITENQVSKS